MSVAFISDDAETGSWMDEENQWMTGESHPSTRYPNAEGWNLDGDIARLASRGATMNVHSKAVILSPVGKQPKGMGL